MALYQLPLGVLGVVLATLLLGFCEVGYRVGSGVRRRRGEDPEKIVATLQGALLALVGLLLAFTFGMANSRFEARKQLVVQEANDIGTTWLRTAFLPEPERSASRELLRAYLAERVEFYGDRERSDDPALLAAFLDGSRRQLDALWAEATRAAERSRDDHPVALYVEALNATIDTHSSRLAAARNHVPETTLLLLAALTAGSAWSIGHSAGLSGKRHFLTTTTFNLLIVLVIVVVLDIDRPRRGWIRVSQGPLVELLESFSPAP